MSDPWDLVRVFSGPGWGSGSATGGTASPAGRSSRPGPGGGGGQSEQGGVMAHQGTGPRVAGHRGMADAGSARPRLPSDPGAWS